MISLGLTGCQRFRQEKEFLEPYSHLLTARAMLPWVSVTFYTPAWCSFCIQNLSSHPNLERISLLYSKALARQRRTCHTKNISPDSRSPLSSSSHQASTVNRPPDRGSIMVHAILKAHLPVICNSPGCGGRDVMAMLLFTELCCQLDKEG